jgi:hypothetical protein
MSLYQAFGSFADRTTSDGDFARLRNMGDF